MLHLMPLPAGSPLWPELVTEVESKRALERAAAEAAAAEAQGAGWRDESYNVCADGLHACAVDAMFVLGCGCSR